MLNSGKIFLAALVGVLIFFGGVTRFHHHIDGAEICFCSGVLSGDVCHHDHHDTDACAHTNEGDTNDDNCPLHLDIFIVSDTQLIDIPLICCHNHCDLCSPLAYNHEHTSRTLSFAPLVAKPLDSGYSKSITRRGPPA